MNTTAPVIALDHPAALDVARVGRKAANLAAARAAGLPAAPGVVLTTDWASDDRASAVQLWRITSHDGARPLVVRASPIADDRRTRPVVGAIDTPTVVRGAEAMLAAVDAVRAGDRADRTPVLLQPYVPDAWRGALFADDAAAGWRGRPVVAARAGDAASDDADWTAELDHAGRVLAELSSPATDAPSADVLVRLSRLAAKVASAFGGPQDLEWSADSAGRLHLLRVRPILHLHVAPAGRLEVGADEVIKAA